MSNDFSPIEPTDNEAPMFAGVPSWERGKKRRTFGRSSPAAAEPRSFAPEFAPEPGDPIPTRPATLSDDARAYEARMDTVDPTDTGFASGATFADRSSRKGNGAMPIMVAAGVILVGGLAAAGWYATQPHNTGVAELTPGSSATTTTTTETASATPAPPAEVAQAAPPPAAARSTSITTTTHAPRGTVSHTTVTRAAPARSADEVGANASTTAAPVRATPTPAPSAAPPAAAAAPAPLVLTLPPQAAPPAEAPAPTQTAPAQTPPQPPTQTPPSR